MSECKTRTTQTNLGTFRRNQTYSGIIQAYLEPCLTLTYLKLWYIQNPNTFRTRGIFATQAYSRPSLFRTPLYSESWHIQNLRHIQNPVAHLWWSINYFDGCNYFHKLLSFSQSLPAGREFLIYLLTYSNK